MTQANCSRCNRQASCSLRSLALLTLPWVKLAHGLDCSEWERSRAIKRALRGDGESPGFVEDWLFHGAITEADLASVIETILHSESVNLSTLCRPCRHYLGPAIDDHADLSDASLL